MGQVDEEGRGILPPGSFTAMYKAQHHRILTSLTKQPCWSPGLKKKKKTEKHRNKTHTHTRHRWTNISRANPWKWFPEETLRHETSVQCVNSRYSVFSGTILYLLHFVPSLQVCFKHNYKKKEVIFQTFLHCLLFWNCFNVPLANWYTS